MAQKTFGNQPSQFIFKFLGLGTVGLFLSCSLAAANTPSTTSPASSVPAWRSKQSHSLLLSGQNTQLAPNDVIQENRNLSQPQWKGDFFYRPDITLQFRRLFRLVLRPQIGVQQSQTKVQNPHEVWITTQGRAQLFDAYVESAPSENQRLIWGLQTFQWGPAEFLNVSNPTAQFRAQSRNPLFLEKGRGLIRWMYTPSLNWNHTFIVEPISNNEVLLMEGETFGPSGFLKSEFSRNSGTTYLGFVAGVEDGARGFLGSYSSLMLWEGFSFYWDARTTHLQKSHRPGVNLFGAPVMNRIETNSSTTRSLVGLRWEGDVDFRTEYFYQPLGYDRSEFEQALAAIAASPLTGNNAANRFLRPGLDLWGQRFLYFSLRYGNWGPKKIWNLSLRHLRSLTDNSSTNMLTFDSPWGDHTLLTAEITANSGTVFSEFKLLQTNVYWVGAKYTF